MRQGTKISIAMTLTAMEIIVAVLPVSHAIFNTSNQILMLQGTAKLNESMPGLALLPATLQSYQDIIYWLLPILTLLSWCMIVYDSISDNKYQSQNEEGPIIQGMQEQ